MPVLFSSSKVSNFIVILVNYREPMSNALTSQRSGNELSILQRLFNAVGVSI